MHFPALYGLLNGFHAARVLVLGDVMLDRFVYGSVERISPEAPIPVVNVERVADMPGGAANVARNIAEMGARAILLGVVGDDAWAQDLRVQLAASPTIEPRLIADASRPTSVKTRYVADGQQVMRADRESRAPLSAGVERRVLDEYSVALGAADIVVLSDYAKGVLSDSVTHAAIDAARRAGKTVIVDPKSNNFARYRGATVLTPNRVELQQACGRDVVTDEEVADAAKGVLGQGICDVMVVTRGKDGMSVVNGRDPAVHLPTSARQVFDVLEMPVPARGRRTDVPDPAVSGISIEDLRVEYPGRGGPVLDGISLAVEPGQVLAITGPSGCGKSTLLAVLLGFVGAYGGSVQVGGVDLTTLDPEAWRARVSWMPQRPHLFAASIAENIRLARPDATTEQIWAAVAAAGLRDVVAARPDGLDARLGDRGVGLSVGERQRVALARAFLRDAPVLLLDEPTANLDGATEQDVLEALERLVPGRTVILVAHRPALVDLADRVLRLDRLPVAA